MDEKRDKVKKTSSASGKNKSDNNIIIEKLRRFYADIKSEFKKIVWPKRDELVKQTFVVIIICAIIGAVIFGMDSVFSAVLKIVAEVI